MSSLPGSRSPVALAAVLVVAGVVAAGYAAAALAWNAGYAAHLGPPLARLGETWTVAARAALVVGAGGALGLALFGRRRAALWAVLAVVVGAPAAMGVVYTPADGLLWTSQVVRTVGLDAPDATLAVGAGAAGGLLALALLVVVTAPRPTAPSSAHGTAAWGEGRSMVEAFQGLVLGRGGGTPPEPGHAVDRSPRDGKRKPGPLLRYDGPGHVLTVAPTRAGKGVGAVVPNLLDHPGPVLVTDPKGENLALTARYRAGVLGHDVVALDPFGLADPDLFGPVGRGAVWNGALNPLDLVGEGSLDAADDAALLAEMLVVDGDHGGSPFWADEAKALLAGLVLFVAVKERGERRTLLAVRDLLTLGKDAFDGVISDMQAMEAHPAVRRAGNRMDQKHERERSAVVSTAQSHTHFLDSARMARVLGRSTFDPADLRPPDGGAARPEWGDPSERSFARRPLSVYLLLPPDRLDAFSRWLRLVVATTLSALAKLGPVQGGAAPASRRALLLLDEFAQLGPMPPVRRAVSLMAGYGIQVWPFLQDLGQLRRLYPKDWESFVANADAVQAFGTTDQFTAEYLSKMAGTGSSPEGSNSARSTKRLVVGSSSRTWTEDRVTPIR